MVEYVDGSFMAQLSTTDMKFPIQYALLYPERVAAPFARLDLARIRTLEFTAVDPKRFPAVALAYAACRAGGFRPGGLHPGKQIPGDSIPARGHPIYLDVFPTVR